jgi:hypothetical protein
MNSVKLLVLGTTLILSSCSLRKEPKEVIGSQKVTNIDSEEVTGSQKITNIDSEKIMVAKSALRALHETIQDDAPLIYNSDMNRVAFVERFIKEFPLAEVKCRDNSPKGKAGEIYEDIVGSESSLKFYLELCEFHVENQHLINIEFAYSHQKGGEFIGMSNSELMFEQANSGHDMIRD